jgi:hypothetical protein
VIETRIVRSSGAAALDEEALALLRRAQPFPAPPLELPGDRVDLSVPIRFNLSEGERPRIRTVRAKANRTTNAVAEAMRPGRRGCRDLRQLAESPVR